MKALRVKKYNFVMKTNFKVATARDCQDSRGKWVSFIVVLLTSFRTSYIFPFVPILLSRCTRLKQKRTIFSRRREYEKMLVVIMLIHMYLFGLIFDLNKFLFVLFPSNDNLQYSRELEFSFLNGKFLYPVRRRVLW